MPSANCSTRWCESPRPGRGRRNRSPAWAARLSGNSPARTGAAYCRLDLHQGVWYPAKPARIRTVRRCLPEYGHMSDIFREVDEDLRRDRLEMIWMRYGAAFVGAVLVIVAGTAGFVAWRNHQHAEAETKTAQLADALRLAGN